MFQRQLLIVLFLFLIGCAPTYSRSDLKKYRLETVAIYGSIERGQNYPKEILKFINANLEERLAQFLGEEKGYRPLLWSSKTRPQSQSLALTTAHSQGAQALLSLKSILTKTGSSEPELETQFRLLSLPDKRVLLAGRVKLLIDASSKVDYESVVDGFKEFPERVYEN